MSVFLKVSGQKTGEIKGTATQQGRENLVLVSGVSHQISLPTAAVGATGKRRHGPMVITKEIDGASPLLQGAFLANEPMKVWELQLWRPTGAGRDEQYLTVKLTKATVASITIRPPVEPRSARPGPIEDVAFVYQKIEWVWLDGTITTADSWTSAV